MQEMVDQMNNQLKLLFKWMCDNNLSLNTDKSKFMLIGSKKKLEDIDLDQITLSINNNDLQRVDEFKYLGFLLNKNL